MSDAKPKVKGYECKHAMYRKSQQDPNHDLLMVKEIVHTEDGKMIPNIRLFHDYKREFWLTKPGFQNHDDKKEWEDASKLQKYTTTQARLIPSIAKAVGRPNLQGSMKTIAQNQYLYGCDITTPVLIKQKYMSSFPDCISSNTVAVLDIETDVVKRPGTPGAGDILCISLTCKEKAVIAITKDFLGDTLNVEARVQDAFAKHVKTYTDPKTQKPIIADRNIELEVIVVDTPGQCCAVIINKAHEWKPDAIAIWNIDFDLSEMLKALEKENFDLGDLFSDPKIPREYRTFRYIRGPAQRVTAEGKVLSLHMAERWHTVDCLSSFYFFCAMATYRKLRVAKGNEPNYKLDSILNKHLGIRKLKFDDLLEEKYPGVEPGSLQWHKIMQEHHKIEYLIYCTWDCISVELLDEKTQDLGKAISALNGFSEYSKFPSQPRRLVDNLHFMCLEEGKVIATTSNKMDDENDTQLPSLRDWIVTLPSNLVLDNGYCAIKDLPGIRSFIRLHVADLDCVSTYPTSELVLNISKETTYRELCRFRGLPDSVFREITVNFTGGAVNGTELSQTVFNFPTHDKLLAGFEEFVKMKEAA